MLRVRWKSSQSGLESLKFQQQLTQHARSNVGRHCSPSGHRGSTTSAQMVCFSRGWKLVEPQQQQQPWSQLMEAFEAYFQSHQRRGDSAGFNMIVFTVSALIQLLEWCTFVRCITTSTCSRYRYESAEKLKPGTTDGVFPKCFVCIW